MYLFLHSRINRNFLTGNFPRHFLAAVNLEVL